MALVYPKGFSAADPGGTTDGAGPVTGFAFLDDKNNNSGGVVGLDLVADPTSFDAKGRPDPASTSPSDANVYGGNLLTSASPRRQPITITYAKNGKSASADIQRADLHQRPDQPVRERRPLRQALGLIDRLNGPRFEPGDPSNGAGTLDGRRLGQGRAVMSSRGLVPTLAVAIVGQSPERIGRLEPPPEPATP